MALVPLTTNVEELTTTPFLGLELMPDEYPNWGLITNNNLIRLESNAQSQQEELATVRLSIDASLSQFRAEIVEIRGEVQNEAIQRAAGDAAILANLDVVRFTGTALGPTEVVLTHNRGRYVQTTIINETTDYDITANFDTFIRHVSVNQVGIKVGVSGTYTVICIG